LFRGQLADSVFWIASLVIAMPAGAIADGYGRKRTLVVGVGISMVDIVLFGFAQTFMAPAVANAVGVFEA
jgi:MFS family permease